MLIFLTGDVEKAWEVGFTVVSVWYLDRNRSKFKYGNALSCNRYNCCLFLYEVWCYMKNAKFFSEFMTYTTELVLYFTDI